MELLQRIGYRGPACVQFKRDERDGQLYLLEINTRLPRDNIHVTRCGVNLPLLEYLDLTGQRPRPALGYRLGVRYLDLGPDIFAFLRLHQGGELGMLDWLRSIRPARVHAHFDPRDPLPLLAARRNELPRASRMARDLWRTARGQRAQFSA
jgi:predicted ATP-grasp superfamily ATP-dependent carboligase